MARTEPPALFPASPPGPGPVYQGVCRQIRALLADNTINRDKHAGTIAQARSLAASIDRDSGHHGKQASGVSLAALHAQLDALITRLTGDTPADSDPFGQFLESLTTHDQAPAPHPQV